MQMISTSRFRRLAMAGALISTILLAALNMGAQNNAATVRPISDFVQQQGTFCFPPALADAFGITPDKYTVVDGCVVFVAPVANFIGWNNHIGPYKNNPVTTRCASVDYAGLADKALGGTLGTKFSGKVIERPLSDGRAEVQVILITSNALTFVVDAGCDYKNSPLEFGYRVPEVLSGGKHPALADSLLQIVFINTAPGAPLPDLEEVFAGASPVELISLDFQASAQGDLRAAFGVNEGSLGAMKISQVGTLFRTQFGGATSDGFPVELIDLHVIGR